MLELSSTAMSTGYTCVLSTVCAVLTVGELIGRGMADPSEVVIAPGRGTSRVFKHGTKSAVCGSPAPELAFSTVLLVRPLAGLNCIRSIGALAPSWQMPLVLSY